MLIRPHDEGDEREWRSLLEQVEFGQLVVPGPPGSLPVVLPTHFAAGGDGTYLLHVTADNPVVAALAADHRALLSVTGPYCYVPSSWVPPVGGAPAVPTSYYANVQIEATGRLVRDPTELAGLLADQLRRFEPEHPRPDPADPVTRRRLERIVGVVLTPVAVRAKFKFGGNKPREVRLAVADRLLERAKPGDLEAREHLLRRTESGGAP